MKRIIGTFLLISILGCAEQPPDDANLPSEQKPVIADYELIDQATAGLYDIRLKIQKKKLTVMIENKSQGSLYAPSDLVVGAATAKPFVFLVVRDTGRHKLYMCGRFEVPMNLMGEIVIKPSGKASLSVDADRLSKVYCANDLRIQAYVGSHAGKNYVYQARSNEIELR